MDFRPKNGLSLCAGGGGLDIGLHIAEPEFKTRCYVELEEYPQQVLIAAQRAGYLSPAPIWDDVTSFDGAEWRGNIDTILAGYPCQPFSQAGQRKGADDSRHLWPHIARIIQEVQPRWVFLENVAGHVSLGAETVLRELWDMGWTPATGLFSASETGAPHQRLRWFCVAYSNSFNWRTDSGEPDIWTDRRHEPFGRGRNDLGHAKRATNELRREPGDVSEAERNISTRGEFGSASANMADACEPRPQGRERPEPPDKWHWSPAHGSIAERGRPWLYPPAPGDADAWADACAMAPGLAPATSFGDCAAQANQLAALVAAGKLAETAAESDLCRMVDGLAVRSRALRLLGNGVVPLCAATAWRSLANAHGLRPVDLEAASKC